MKRRDFVKFAALLPVAPVMVAASQLTPATGTETTSLAIRGIPYPEFARDSAGFTREVRVDTKRCRFDGFWVTFDDVKKQTNFLRGHFGNQEDFWYTNTLKNFNTVHSVVTVRTWEHDPNIEVTKISFGPIWFCVWVGAKISINVLDPSICIEQTALSGLYPNINWKWTRETYKETVIRVATELDAFNPEWLLLFAKYNKVPQTQIKSWMREKKNRGNKINLHSHFKADITSGVGGSRS